MAHSDLRLQKGETDWVTQACNFTNTNAQQTKDLTRYGIEPNPGPPKSSTLASPPAATTAAKIKPTLNSKPHGLTGSSILAKPKPKSVVSKPVSTGLSTKPVIASAASNLKSPAAKSKLSSSNSTKKLTPAAGAKGAQVKPAPKATSKSAKKTTKIGDTKVAVSSTKAAPKPIAISTPSTSSSPRPSSACAVSLSFLKKFSEKVPNWSLSTGEVVQRLIIPETADKRCRYADLLTSEQRSTPTYFISHRWKDSFLTMCDSLQSHLIHQAQAATVEGKFNLDRMMSTTFVWLDVFAINQHLSTQECELPHVANAEDPSLTESTSDMLTGLVDSLAAAKQGTILMLDRSGGSLSRIWILFEIHRTLELHENAAAHFTVLLPRGAPDFDTLRRIWASLDVRRAQATLDRDRVRILEDISASSLGVEKLNERIKHAIVSSSEHALKVSKALYEKTASSSKAFEEEKQYSLLTYLQTVEQQALMLQMTAAVGPAVQLMTEAMQLVKSGSMSDSIHTSYLAQTFASLLLSVGRSEESIIQLNDALRIRINLAGEDSPSLAPLYSELAGALESVGRYQETGELYTKALQITEEYFNETDAGADEELVRIGVLHQQLLHYEKAEDCFRRAMELLQQRYGSDQHPILSEIHYRISLIQRATKRIPEAVDSLRKCIAIRQAAYGDVHPDTSFAMEVLAETLSDASEYKEALQLFETAEKSAQQVYGVGNIQSARILEHHARCLWHMNQFDAALLRIDECLNAQNQSPEILGPERYGICLTWKATILSSMGKESEAAACLAKRDEILSNRKDAANSQTTNSAQH